MKHFPLRNHRFAAQSAIASMAAHKQGKFWPYHDKLFEKYSQINDKLINDIAIELGLDMERFKKDVSNPKIIEKVNNDFQEGVKVDVRGTPTIFINGKLLRSRSIEGIQQMIEKTLRKKK